MEGQIVANVGQPAWHGLKPMEFPSVSDMLRWFDIPPYEVVREDCLNTLNMGKAQPNRNAFKFMDNYMMDAVSEDLS